MSGNQLEKLVSIRSALVEEMMDYCERLVKVAAASSIAPYLGGRKPVELYVEPDVLIRECKPRGGAGLVAERSRRAGLPSESREIGEEDLYGGASDEVERRAPWRDELDAMRRGAFRWAVVLGPPGQGKSQLVRMSARRLALEALQMLRERRTSVGAIPLPLSMDLAELAAPGGVGGESPEEELQNALRRALRRSGCGNRAAEYLARHANHPRSWLFLDALDEVGDDRLEQLTVFAEVLRRWSCRVVITSRPYGFYAEMAPGGSREYRLAPFSEEQSKALIDRWFGGCQR